MARILVVDDDPDICALLEFRLGGADHEIVVEHDGEAALAVLDRQQIDLVILDWMMPRMSGLEACLALRAQERFASLPVFLLTAKSQEADVQRGLAAGADDYIVKPFSPREVAARVESTLARSRV
jgi:DNA-binding response OmpR family regulator